MLELPGTIRSIRDDKVVVRVLTGKSFKSVEFPSTAEESRKYRLGDDVVVQIVPAGELVMALDDVAPALDGNGMEFRGTPPLRTPPTW